MNEFQYQKDSNNIVVVTMDMAGPVNTMGDEFRQAFASVLTRLECEESLSGVVLASAKSTFFAGGDLDEILAFEQGQEQATFEVVSGIKSDLRRLETLAVPVVAAINGAALGGGLELCLACHHRIATDRTDYRVGLPEVTLGLLPGGGGIVRLVHLLGLQKALPFLLEGKILKPGDAVKEHLVDELVGDEADLIPAAKRWIESVVSDGQFKGQPWDRGLPIPGGGPRDPAVMQFIAGMPAILTKNTRRLVPAAERILSVAVEVLRVDFDTAMRIETRQFITLLATPQAKNLVTNFMQMNSVQRGASRPDDVTGDPISKVGVLGSGMMGRGIAYVSAASGYEVVLKDVSQELAEAGKAQAGAILDKAIKRGRMTESGKQEILGRIRATADAEDLRGCDLIIEAVFEDADLKKQLTHDLEPKLADGGMWATNTSSLPISLLSEASSNQENFIGLHFFSPVDKMPLVEIICGKSTSETSLARCFDFVRSLGKTPIVVNDSLGFYTSRTFGTTLDEAARLVYEGVNPYRIESLGKAIGMPVGPLALSDEVSQSLNLKIHETWEKLGVLDSFGEQEIWRKVLRTLVNYHGRGGRYHGGGYYEYTSDSSKSIWTGLFEIYQKPDVEMSDEDIKDRLLFRPVIEALKCFEEGVVNTVADANVGSLLGIGAPRWTGGYIQFVNTYGLRRFSQRCDELVESYGSRFSCPNIVNQYLESGRQFG